jgi:FtsP/CotA-like multicopper oxidase with cupredoxin domain
MAGHSPEELEQLPEARPSELVELRDGETYHMRIAPVRKRIGGSIARMLAYNGSVPGPTLRVPEGAKATVHVRNDGDLETTVHWYGLRLANRFDGTHETQAAIPVGESFRYEIEAPDPGAYWYHPHIREDYGQELGLYGSILVVPSDGDYWPPAHREVMLTLDDVLLQDGRIAAFDDETIYVAMGRFGNVMLVAGEDDLVLDARCGEVVRLYLTNTANTRVFNVALPSARMKLVGGDSGRVEHEALVEEALVAPSERVIVDVLFEKEGELHLEHRTPERTYLLARIAVRDETVDLPLVEAFATLRTNADLVAERERIAPYLDAEPDKTLAFVGEMDLEGAGGATSYACPMHPEITSEKPARCPKCGMKLVPAGLVGAREHGEHHGHEHAHGRSDALAIEWEDDMVEVNRLTTASNMRWKLVDRETGAANAEIDWRFRVGDEVKIRLVNELDSDHPMPHQFHVHGAGRFLVLSRDDVVEPNLVWKDTVLVRTGETVEILLSVTNPGVWMAHCHIAEHHEGGMMLSFEVDDR